MRYDDINNLLEKKPWVAVIITLLVVCSCLSILFLNYDTKTDPSASPIGKVAHRMTQKTLKTLQTHKALRSQSLGEMNKPFINELTLVESPVTNKRYVPLCARCNLPLRAVSPTLFECPVCKQRALVGDPENGVAMYHVHIAQGMCQQGGDPNSCPVHGSYFCPVCQKIVAPNWGRNGAPLCPYCNNNVQLR
ncbi:MAG: hypothetical protein HQK54_12270 [Oligoflexales bacterium]|nr:hypothetical protein [Oligoflexales bacterium]